MVQIKAVPVDSVMADELLKLLKSEWPELENFVKFYNEMDLPDPIVAVVSGEVVGGYRIAALKRPMEIKGPYGLMRFSYALTIEVKALQLH